MSSLTLAESVPTVLAVDPARRTGWAASDGTSGAERFDCWRDTKQEATVRHGLLARRFRSWLVAKITATQSGIMILERQQVGRGGAEVMLGMRFVALLVAGDHRLAVVEVAPSRWQAWGRKNGVWCREDKSDEVDARTMLAWWTATQKGAAG